VISPSNKRNWHDTPQLDVRLLGTVDFESAQFLQERLVYEISGRTDLYGGVFLCEHPPLITVGRAGSRAHVLLEQKDLATRGLQVRWLNRGGGCLVHSPGQLAVYPVVPLQRLGMGLQDYRTALVASVLDLCDELDIAAWPVERNYGVAGRGGVFTFVGAAVKRWVAYQGMFINVNPLMQTQRLVSIGASGLRPTSLEALRGRAISMATVRESLIRNLARRLGYTQYQVFTGHPLLVRTRRVTNVCA
jgi:lipoyl(octanoyl) transferase